MTLYIKVKAGSKVDQLVYDAAGLLTAKLKAPAQGGKANAHLLEYMAVQFGIAKSQISLISGFANSYKRFEVDTNEALIADLLAKLP